MVRAPGANHQPRPRSDSTQATSRFPAAALFHPPFGMRPPPTRAMPAADVGIIVQPADRMLLSQPPTCPIDLMI